MGDRANINVKINAEDSGVYLYSHWMGSDLPSKLKAALGRRQRWNDPSYLTRIIFDKMTDGYHGEETGFGISTQPPDGEDRVLEVNCETKTVTEKWGKSAVKTYSFEDYSK